jgi:hypothetical protein
MVLGRERGALGVLSVFEVSLRRMNLPLKLLVADYEWGRLSTLVRR